MSKYASGALATRAHAKPIPRYERGVSRARLHDPRPGLADDLDFLNRGQWGHASCDPDLELFTWPEVMDQRAIGEAASSPYWHDDAEEDDDDTGIEDVGQDAGTEDGI